MTLIQTFNIGGVVTVVTCDTRQTVNILGKQFRYLDAKNKLKRISTHCLFAGGGQTQIIDDIRDQIDNKAVYLDDFVKLLEEAINENSIGTEDELFQIYITGFNKDKSTGRISYQSGGEIKYQRYKYFAQDYSIIAPSDDEIDVALSMVSPPTAQTKDELASAAVSYAAQVQSAFYANNALTVSEKCNYSAIYLSDSGFKYFEGQLNVEELE